jgi:hypothetical protein
LPTARLGKNAAETAALEIFAPEHTQAYNIRRPRRYFARPGFYTATMSGHDIAALKS